MRLDDRGPTAKAQDALPLLDPIAAYTLWAETYPPHAHNGLMQAEERALLSLLPTDLCGHRVLDAGCGSGRYILHALKRGAAQVVGVDISWEMLTCAASALHMEEGRQTAATRPGPRCIQHTAYCVRASLDAVPVCHGWADLTLCGLTLGHVEDLHAVLAELRRVTRPGGVLLCSDLHPIGQARGWQRVFTAGGRRYAVRHYWHSHSDWQRVCQDLGLQIVQVLEPQLDPSVIPAGARFDPAALVVPVALVFKLRRDP
jgi:malonyl-CoA O-methyltransferase